MTNNAGGSSKDYTGQRFGMLTAVRLFERRNKSSNLWLFRCNCDNEIVLVASAVKGHAKRGTIPSCGCVKLPGKYSKDYTGMTFGELTAIRLVKKLGSRKSNLWLFLCKCGKEVIRSAAQVQYHTKKGHLASCGCSKPDRRPWGEAAHDMVLGKYKASAKVRNLPWGLSLEQADELFSGSCRYCGIKPSNSTNRKGQSGLNGHFVYNGIDRVDNKVGYFIDNCVSCCSRCNYMKGSMKQHEFVKWLDQIAIFRCK